MSQKIREVLRLSGIRNTEVAKSLGMSKDWIGNLIRRDNLDTGYTVRILDAINEILRDRDQRIQQSLKLVEKMYEELR